MNIEKFSADDLLGAAKTAEVAERYEDMCKFLHKLVQMKCESKEMLTVDERNLLSVAYKNVVGTKRQSRRILSEGQLDMDKDMIDSYRSIVEKELEDVCNEVLELLKKTTEVSKEDDTKKEDQVFYLKMSGDYYRYLSEFRKNNEYETKAEKYYKEAMEIAEGHLPETHPTRLGLALNYSVCCYEILNHKEQGCEIAKKAFDAAIEKLDMLNDSSYKDSTLIMQLLRDNLTLWTSEQIDEADDAEN
jgi:hypothetical protein